MNANPNVTIWSQLKPGDTIVCPGTGREERVLAIRPYERAKGSNRPPAVFVRTDRHDHIKGSFDVVVTVQRCTSCGELVESHEEGCGNA